jgi:hypothetical protein
MTSRKVSDHSGDIDLPATSDDVRALRRHRPESGENWLDDLATLARQAPRAAVALRERRTFAGLPPFEL